MLCNDLSAIKGWLGAIALIALAGSLAGCSGAEERSSTAAEQASHRMLLANGADGNWASYGGGYNGDHFSPLNQINEDNADQLGLVWSVDLGQTISSHSAPLAVDGVVYYSIGHSIISAVEAETGKKLWTFDAKVNEVAADKLRPAWGSRGIGYWDHKIYTGTTDGRLIAIDARTGKAVWSVQTTMGPNDGRYITGAPLVFDGKVIIGHGGADYGPVRGYVTTYDAQTGKKLWRFYTVPGNPAEGADGEASDSVMPMAAKTWKGEWWKFGGGGTVWNSMAYDAELDRVYIGTGNGAPWNQNIRSPGGGDNLFLCSIVALDAKTGKYLWHYQINPGETWDFNAAMDIELATLTIDGKPRRVLMQAPKNGFFYVIDRETGKLISAEKFAKVTWASAIGPDGRPIETPEARFPTGEALIWPGGTGAHNWQAMSFSPASGLVYIPMQDLPGYYNQKGMDLKTWKPATRAVLDTGFQGFDTKDLPPPTDDKMGSLLAWDPLAQKARWSVPMLMPFNGGIASTAGNLVFQGNIEGKFVAYAADTGKVLWSFDAQNGIIGPPIVYQFKGRQYVTIMTGVSAMPSNLGPASGRFGWDYRTTPRRLLTFALGGTARLPAAQKASLEVVDDPSVVFDMAQVTAGSLTYGKTCIGCHGSGAVSGGTAPDLRASQAVLDPKTFAMIVRGGALVPNGMPRYDELSDADLAAIRMFIRYRARMELRPQAGTANAARPRGIQ